MNYQLLLILISTMLAACKLPLIGVEPNDKNNVIFSGSGFNSSSRGSMEPAIAVQNHRQIFQSMLHLTQVDAREPIVQDAWNDFQTSLPAVNDAEQFTSTNFITLVKLAEPICRRFVELHFNGVNNLSHAAIVDQLIERLVHEDHTQIPQYQNIYNHVLSIVDNSEGFVRVGSKFNGAILGCTALLSHIVI